MHKSVAIVSLLLVAGIATAQSVEDVNGLNSVDIEAYGISDAEAEQPPFVEQEVEMDAPAQSIDMTQDPSVVAQAVAAGLGTNVQLEDYEEEDDGSLSIEMEGDRIEAEVEIGPEGNIQSIEAIRNPLVDVEESAGIIEGTLTVSNLGVEVEDVETEGENLTTRISLEEQEGAAGMALQDKSFATGEELEPGTYQATVIVEGTNGNTVVETEELTVPESEETPADDEEEEREREQDEEREQEGEQERNQEQEMSEEVMQKDPSEMSREELVTAVKTLRSQVMALRDQGAPEEVPGEGDSENPGNSGNAPGQSGEDGETDEESEDSQEQEDDGSERGAGRSTEQDQTGQQGPPGFVQNLLGNIL